MPAPAKTCSPPTAWGATEWANAAETSTRPLAYRHRACACRHGAADSRHRSGFPHGLRAGDADDSNGQEIRGVKKNEDPFSVQVMDNRERIQGYLREDMRSVTNEKKSAMPTFGSTSSPMSSSTTCSHISRPCRETSQRNPKAIVKGVRMFRRSSTRFALAALGATVVAVTVAAQGVPPGLVTSQELLAGLPADGSRWVMFGGSYTNQRHSPLTRSRPRT